MSAGLRYDHDTILRDFLVHYFFPVCCLIGWPRKVSDVVVLEEWLLVGGRRGRGWLGRPVVSELISGLSSPNIVSDWSEERRQ